MRTTISMLFFAGLLLCFCNSRAQITHRDILQTFIRNYQGDKGSLNPVAQEQFRPFPQSPEGWKKILPDTVIQQLIHNGELALKTEFKNIPATVTLEYVRNGNRTDYERLSFRKRSQLWNLVLAESVEGKNRFTDHIVDGVWSISEESFWGANAHLSVQKSGVGLPNVEEPIVDLFAAETASILAWTDYFVGSQLDKVSKLVRPRISYEITRRVLTPMETTKFGWMGGGNSDEKLNNWAPWISSNYLIAALIIEKNDKKRAEDQNRAVKIVDQYLNGLGADGGCEEGPGYWSAAGGCVYDVLNILYDSTNGKFNIYQNSFIQKIGLYIYKTHIAGEYFINVGDAHPKLRPSGLMIYRLGKDTDYQPMMNFGSWMYKSYGNGNIGEQFVRTRALYNMKAFKATARYPSKEQYVNDVWYSDVQLMSSRSNNGLFVASHGGNNGESHNHNDVGDFLVYADGQPVIIDVGSGTYTARTFGKDRYELWFNTSPYHNLPTINGQQQDAGTQFAATDVKYDQKKDITMLSMNIAKAYPAEAGVTTWLRTIKMDKQKGDIKVTDAYQLSSSLKSLTQSFMSVCDVSIAKPGNIVFSLPNNSKVYLDYDVSAWTVEKEKIEFKTPEDQGIKHNWEGKSVWRILLTAKVNNTSGKVQYKIHR